jgi:hypothetical protein
LSITFVAIFINIEEAVADDDGVKKKFLWYAHINARRESKKVGHFEMSF